MRGLWTALALTLALAACQPTAPGPGPDQPIAEQTLPPPETLPETLAETAPDASPEIAPAPSEPVADPAAPAAEPAPEPPPEPPLLAQQRRLCERAGGRLGQRAPGIYACLHQTGDAGRSCNAARDCEGLCLARSGTCAPFTPLFGCHEVFTLPGRRETLCTD